MLNIWRSAYFPCNDYFVIGGIHTYLGVSTDPNIPVDFFEFLSTKFAACSKPPSRDNHRKASYPRMQQRDQGAGWTQIMRSGSSWKRRLYPFGHAASIVCVWTPEFFFMTIDGFNTLQFEQTCTGSIRKNKNNNFLRCVLVPSFSN